MITEGQLFYNQSSLASYTRRDILTGRVIKINPALITITDGLVSSTPAETLQNRVETEVTNLVVHNVHTFHVDINFPDYSGFGTVAPDVNTGVFTPEFLASLNDTVRSKGAFLNLHLLTDYPTEHLAAFTRVPFGAVCFQLDAVDDARALVDLVNSILDMGSCPSPVVETIGTGQEAVATREEVLETLDPVLSTIGMLTFQAAGTASRSSTARGALALDSARSYIDFLCSKFDGTIQLQGGVKTETIAQAVQLGAEFLVCGTEIFRNSEGKTPDQVVDGMLEAAAGALL
jgi:pentose-5-phosphate-3-epimerase